MKKYRLTREKAKYVLVTICPKLAHIVKQYELGGAGAGQRNEKDDSYGRVDLTKCIDGDNSSSFIHSLNDTYFLYWWHKLVVKGFV